MRREISHGIARSKERVCFHSIIAREFPAPGVKLKLSATKRDGAEAISALSQLIITAVFNEYVGKETLAAPRSEGLLQSQHWSIGEKSEAINKDNCNPEWQLTPRR